MADSFTCSATIQIFDADGNPNGHLCRRATTGRGVHLHPNLDAVSQVEKVAMNRSEEGRLGARSHRGELSFMRGADFRP